MNGEKLYQSRAWSGQPEQAKSIAEVRAGDHAARGCFVLAIMVGGVVLAFSLFFLLGPHSTPAVAPTPAPQETPWLWVDPAVNGGACYVYKDALGPCFVKPSPTP